MGEWWTTVPTEMSMGNNEISSISQVTMSPSRQNNLVSMYSSLALSKSSYSGISAFCTEENIPQCISYISQELDSLGLSSTCIEVSSPGGSSLNAVPALNAMYELLQIHRRNMCALEELEKEQLKKSNTLEHVQISNSRLKDQLELSMREKSGLHEAERQLQLKIKTLQSCLKTEKDEVQKLQNIIASRASQYSHDAKRKEREAVKLKERLSQLLVDRKDKKLAIDVLNCLGRSDGKRSHWRTAKASTNHESEMYKSLLNDYESSQRSLMVENAELKKVLQQMKKEMIHILSPPKSSTRGATADDSLDQADSDGDEKAGNCSRETLDQSCEQAREQLTSSIRQQWRKLRSHMEKLDSQASQMQNQLESSKEVIPRETHEDEMERMRNEIQQCKEFIHAQQQLLQQQLNTSFDDETAALLNDCYTLEEKERLKEEWRLFEEQKRNFERERKNFTEAAIRLGREKKAFEEDRASWLKNQFLNITPFRDHRSCSSDGQSALSIRSEPEIRMSSTKTRLAKSSTYTTFSTPKPTQSATVPSTTELYRTLRLIPDSRHLHRGSWQESSAIDDGDTRLKSKNRVRCGDLSIFSLGEDENSLT
ncbi:synovial sarcoma, X breakpoint 2 interacting protein a [Mastacembelus armatus]|uniref:Synovial sarcoma, X breakpoint 2 interacting protein a n=1 Tax=Mastacembelus armatus TaxID=205130 RepID=A0A3Q3MKS4_9TELE|nr:afadin- and alpha-actinin-binding protein [Mastacembelus armatus]XP_026170165.1 afadin- and alpha-actinin-binding protein [Mastacembelus armatus]XP_026170166.1 afadin- and alpha-actinin-binding protein [Mastacembelus armatus]